MGQSIFAWANLTQVALRNLFNGDQDGLTALTNLISDGKFIEGAVNGAGNYPRQALALTTHTPRWRQVLLRPFSRLQSLLSGSFRARTRLSSTRALHVALPTRFPHT